MCVRVCVSVSVFLLEQLQALVVQGEPGVPRQVQLLQLGRQTLREGDLRDLVTAHIHTLQERGGARGQRHR